MFVKKPAGRKGKFWRRASGTLVFSRSCKHLPETSILTSLLYGMETNADWTESALFSPSKARVQQAQAKDWASVDAWLSKKYASKRLPAFERNEDTLQALLTLAKLNDSVDEQRSHIDRVEKAALQAHSKRTPSTTNDINQTLSESLDDHGDLDALAKTMVSLDISKMDLPTTAVAIVDLTSRKFEADQQAHHTETQLTAIKAEHRRVADLLTGIQQDSFFPPPNLAEQTPEWIRSTKHLKAKIAEYDERLSTVRTVDPSSTNIETVAKLIEDLSSHKETLAALSIQLEAFQSLPSDARPARARLECARDELRTFLKQRDQLFEQLVDH